jgi:hypothetical protein
MNDLRIGNIDLLDQDNSTKCDKKSDYNSQNN